MTKLVVYEGNFALDIAGILPALSELRVECAVSPSLDDMLSFDSIMRLQKLDLCKMEFCTNKIDKLLYLLSEAPNLRSLLIDMNWLTSANYLQQFLAQTSLVELELINLNPGMGLEFFSAIETNKTLEKIQIRVGKISALS